MSSGNPCNLAALAAQARDEFWGSVHAARARLSSPFYAATFRVGGSRLGAALATHSNEGEDPRAAHSALFPAPIPCPTRALLTLRARCACGTDVDEKRARAARAATVIEAYERGRRARAAAAAAAGRPAGRLTAEERSARAASAARAATRIEACERGRRVRAAKLAGRRSDARVRWLQAGGVPVRRLRSHIL